MPSPGERDFLAVVLSNPLVEAVLDRAARLALPDWYLTAGCLFQTVWNVLDGHPATRGLRDYDLFYFDSGDLSWEAEDAAIARAAEAFADVGVQVELRNEARVHLWYEQRFGKACPQFTSSADAVDHFAATACSVAVRREPDGSHTVYAPFGLDDLFDFVLRPNPVLAPQEVYEAKAARWQALWPRLVMLPWPEQAAQADELKTPRSTSAVPTRATSPATTEPSRP